MLYAIKLLRKPDEKINFFTEVEAKMLLAIKLLRKPDEKINYFYGNGIVTSSFYICQTGDGEQHGADISFQFHQYYL